MTKITQNPLVSQNPFDAGYIGTFVPHNPDAPVFDVSNATNKTPDGISQFVQDVIKSGLSDGVITMLLVQVLVIASKNRQDERLIALKQATTSLELAKSAASSQLAAAKSQAIGAFASGGLTIVGAAVDGTANAISLGMTMRNDAKIDKDANRLFPKDQGSGNKGDWDSNSTSAPPAYDDIIKHGDFDEKGALAQELAKGDSKLKRELASKDSNNAATNADPDANELARTHYKSDQARVYATKQDTRLRLVQAATTIITTIGKFAEASMTLDAGEHTAQAALEKALAEYMSARSSNSNEYAAEAGQVVQAALQAIASVENSRHKAIGGIWA